MPSLPPTVRVSVAVEPIDVRGSFDSLAGAVRRLGLDPVDGHLHLFLDRRRRIAKALWFHPRRDREKAALRTQIAAPRREGASAPSPRRASHVSLRRPR